MSAVLWMVFDASVVPVPGLAWLSGAELPAAPQSGQATAYHLQTRGRGTAR